VKRSLTALVSRGIDTSTAERLIAKGYTLGKLQQVSENEIKGLGLTKLQYASVTQSKRPAIPEDVATRVLHASRWCCCVCRLSKPIILHHIKPWHESHDHSPENLAVLCLDCHGEAHTKRDLALNLTADRILAHKQEWEEQVRRADAAALVQRASAEGASWDYINVPRLYELAVNYRISATRVEYFRAAQAQGVVDRQGTLTPGITGGKSAHRYYFAQGPTPIVTDLFLRALLHEVVAKLDLIDLTSHWTRRDIVALVKPGSFIWLQGLHRYRTSTTERNSEAAGLRQVQIRRRGIAVRFDIDPWWSLSNTSYSYHLRGQHSAASFCTVRDICVTEGVLNIAAGCIAVGTAFEYPNRPQIPGVARQRLVEQDEQEDND
jgi:hypothetical protein